MPDFPDLPTAAHAEVDSMLARKFGREIANYFSGSPLNRLSFLRTDPAFLTAAFAHPSARFLLLRELSPLAHSLTALAWASRADVDPLLPRAPFTHKEDEQAQAYDSRQPSGPQLVFLGIDEGKASPASATAKPTYDATVQESPAEPAAKGEKGAGELFSWKIYTGRPYFAVDVTPKDSHAEAARALITAKEAAGLKFLEGRTHMTLPAPEAAIYAEARAIADWNARNPFCAGCGQRSISVNAGFKRLCPATDAAGPPRAECATRGRISNLSFPRTDPTIIVAVLSADGQRILLGRQRSWPPLWYSTLAGFIEPGESVEEAVRREVWEEAGIALGRVQVHSTQPWPYPANLMIGCAAQALPDGETISLEYDPELEDARWFTIDEVREALVHGVGGLDDMTRKGSGYKEGNLRLPPKMAIANQLIEAVVNGGFAGSVGKL